MQQGACQLWSCFPLEHISKWKVVPGVGMCVSGRWTLILKSLMKLQLRDSLIFRNPGSAASSGRRREGWQQISTWFSLTLEDEEFKSPPRLGTVTVQVNNIQRSPRGKAAPKPRWVKTQVSPHLFLSKRCHHPGLLAASGNSDILLWMQRVWRIV